MNDHEHETAVLMIFGIGGMGGRRRAVNGMTLGGRGCDRPREVGMMDAL